jgi:ferrochelatase
MPSLDPATSVPSTNGDRAVLLINLGTPAAPTPAAVRRYLAEFLRDPRVIDYPRWLWLPLLYGVILPVRPRRSARAYARIWTAHGSPLLLHSRALAARLDAALAGHGVRVELAMRYGEPSIAQAIARLDAAGVRRLLILPLYPQYSATSTGAALDGVFAALRRQRRIPALCTVVDYHDAPEYIEALAWRVESYWKDHGRGERLLLSFHGIPERYARAGDPYREQCLATAERLRARLGVEEQCVAVAFQSRVGREPWLAPDTEEVLRTWPAEGVRHVQVLCPGFAVDCLETLEEIDLRGRAEFLAAGGARFDYIPALNDTDAHVALLVQLIARNLAA